MYAVIHTGGKQYRVEEGQRLEVERLDAAAGDELTVRPVLLVDGETVLATPTQLADVAVKVRLISETKGPKINGFTYKPKSNNRRRWGHRQHLALVEVTSITGGPTRSRAKQTADAGPSGAKALTDEKPAAKKAAKKTAAKKAPSKKKSPAKKKTPAKKSTKAGKAATPRSKKGGS